MLAAFPLIMCIIGLLIHLLASGKSSEAGRIMYMCGLFITLWKWSALTIHLP